MRVASWNLSARDGGAARLGALLADHGGADLALLQEVSVAGLPKFCEAAGLDWWVHARVQFFDLLRVRGRAGGPRPDGGKHGNARCVAIAGRGEPIRGATLFPDVPLPEKVMAGWIDVGGTRTTVASYHAPTGVQHRGLKPAQAVRLARWLAQLDGPVIFAGDFNTPSADPPDFASVHCHWHTGEPHLEGAEGDDLLVGPEPVHSLRDVLRIHLEANPADLAAVRAERPDGPLQISYRTGELDEHRCRYDAVWLSEDFRVNDVTYLYDEALVAGTDHALVLVDTTLAGRPGGGPEGNGNGSTL